MEDRRRDPADWDATRGLLARLSDAAGEQQTVVAADVVRAVLVERETAVAGAGGDARIPVRFERARLEGILDTLQRREPARHAVLQVVWLASLLGIATMLSQLL